MTDLIHLMKSRDDDINIKLIFSQSIMAQNPAEKTSLREPTADEVRTLSQRMGFVIREEEISAYQGIYIYYINIYVSILRQSITKRIA